MTPTTRGVVVLALLPLIFSAAGAAAEEPERRMTDEDVVRLHVSGLPEERIVERIRASRTDFDLSDEMLQELRAAGLPETLVRAMVERQRELDAEKAASTAEPAPAEPAPGPRLLVRLNPEWKPTENRPRPVLRVRDVIEPPVREMLRLRGNDARFTDAALVLACRTADHVPDQWRSKTPLGRDFIATPRHRLLAFLPGAARREAGRLREIASRIAVVPGERDGLPEPGLLELEIPPALEVELEPGVVHDLTLGVALQAEDRYYLIAADSWDGLVLPETGLTIDAEIESGGGGDPTSVQVRFERAPGPAD